MFHYPLYGVSCLMAKLFECHGDLNTRIITGGSMISWFSAGPQYRIVPNFMCTHHIAQNLRRITHKFNGAHCTRKSTA